MIYPVMIYHNKSFRHVDTAESKVFDQALQWFLQTAAVLPPLIQYRSFSSPETGPYCALLTTGEPFADRDGRNIPTKIMLIFDSISIVELMCNPSQIPALADYMRECLVDPQKVHWMTELPDLSPWMEKREAGEIPSEETDLIHRAVRSGKVCYVADCWETLLSALEKMPVVLRCRTAFSIGWREKGNADLFDVIVADAETAATIRPRTKRIWTKDCHDGVREEEWAEKAGPCVRVCTQATAAKRSWPIRGGRRIRDDSRKWRRLRVVGAALSLALLAIGVLIDGKEFLRDSGMILAGYWLGRFSQMVSGRKEEGDSA